MKYPILDAVPSLKFPDIINCQSHPRHTLWLVGEDDPDHVSLRFKTFLCTYVAFLFIYLSIYLFIYLFIVLRVQYLIIFSLTFCR